MSVADGLLNQALALPEQERANMAYQLLLSLEPEDSDSDAEDAWADEIMARSDAVHRGDCKARDWREALEDIRNQLRRNESP
ncbi:MAG TPA: addiction module protein [Pirellulales bacterium]|nr:addiction module protein [Pirellulales bacterium]